MEEDSCGRYYSLERGAFSASECYPIASISTTQSEEVELGGAPRLVIVPPLTACVLPSKAPERGLYQRFWKLPEAPLKSSVPVEDAFGRYTA
jgi:hypothetical protein